MNFSKHGWRVLGVVGTLACVSGTTPLLAAEPAPKQAESKQAEPAKAEPSKTEPAKTDPAKAEPAKAEPAKPDAGGAVADKKDDRVVLKPGAFTMSRIDGTSEDLAAYRGKVVLIVNVASKCGLTPQYAEMQALYERHKDAGLVILGFPANNFMEQEPGSNRDIAQFCTTEFGVTFPMFEKIDVVGESAHPLFVRLTALAAADMTDADKAKVKPGQTPGAPSWNFTKYLVDRDGRFVQRFDPRTKPSDAALVAKVESLLAMKASEETQPSGEGKSAGEGKPDAGTPAKPTSPEGAREPETPAKKD